MDLKTVKNLLNLISDSDVNEVEIEEGDFKIRIKKQADTVQYSSSAPVYMSPPQGAPYYNPVAPSQTSAPADTPEPTAPSVTAGESASAAERHITVRAPIVGTFYRAPSPETEDFVNEGDTVSKGDVLCIIEAMKIMNEIESEHTGKIIKVLADNAQPVEYNQPLYLIDPS
ncbi:MAG: acetyl-CoA carboxylase biotin carboxyl carrier protein [Balneolales bacterium]